jgi:hypothetical protein
MAIRSMLIVGNGSVNGSGYFSGVATMLTPVDETVSSNVWAQGEKWKGVFKVRSRDCVCADADTLN